ncbi:hypothetical protein [Cupriavidus gilardii]|nr:hypothetical protein [Cupriavidus gilardii]KAB0592482.1 hypothetical protein F7Q96_26335 [Cupriavidus gilardii]MCT9017132.1 hypothetical protein [Cupriavidus gilardii]MCT9056802.1 hypothetical protein [Cupriavidus gilardii]
MKVKRIRKVGARRDRVVTDKLRITPDWVPSAKNVNALPRPLRDYIHRLIAFDPQHYVQKVAVLQDHIRMVEADNERLRRRIEWERDAVAREVKPAAPTFADWQAFHDSMCQAGAAQQDVARAAAERDEAGLGMLVAVTSGRAG